MSNTEKKKNLWHTATVSQTDQKFSLFRKKHCTTSLKQVNIHNRNLQATAAVLKQAAKWHSLAVLAVSQAK